MKVAIVGSRNFPYPDLITDFVDRLPEGTTVVSGGARGPDSIASTRATTRGLPTEIHPADWDRYGKSAGFLRNTTIVETSDWVVAFWDGHSHGTADTIRKTHASHKPLTVVFTPDQVRHYNGGEALWA